MGILSVNYKWFYKTNKINSLIIYNNLWLKKQYKNFYTVNILMKFIQNNELQSLTKFENTNSFYMFSQLDVSCLETS